MATKKASSAKTTRKVRSKNEFSLGHVGTEAYLSLGSDITIHSPAPDPQGRKKSTTLHWKELRHGSCTMRAGSFVKLYEDGSFSFYGVILSTANNDTWHHHIKVFDATDVFLFDLPVLGDDWNWDFATGTANEWHEFAFNETSPFLMFPAHHFARIDHGDARFSC